MKFSASKFLDKKIENEIETRRFHVVYPELDTDLISDIFEDEYDSDWESAMFTWGMYGDYEGDLYSIDADKLAEAIQDRLEDLEDKEWEEEVIERWENLKKQLNLVSGHTLYPEHDALYTKGGKDED